MAIQSDETLVTKGDLKDLYQDKILPYLGGNMMMTTNVSDYYDTNEKIVGVWKDGKPLYQKTYYFSALGNGSTSSVASTRVPTNITNLDIITKIEGVAYDKSNSMHFIPVPVTSGTNTNEWDVSCWAITESGTPNLVISVARDMRSYSAYMTLQYTKTTDAANSAAATPGCYDINRPDLWPVRKEIFFGNGLYGYRITGNFTASASKQRWETDVISLNPETGRIVSTGGSFSVRDASSRLARCTLNSTVVGADAGGNVIIFIESYFYSRSFTGIVVFQVMPDNDFSLTANDTYDVWLTYTK